MNLILQKRIDEAASHYLLHEHKSLLNEILHQCDLKIEMQYHRDIEQAYTEGGKNSLQNQWISVEEALPEEDIQNCFVAYKAMDMVLYSTGSYEKDNDEWYVDGVGYNAEVTHYMPIPSLKGGK